MTSEEIIEGLKLLEDNMVYFDELQNDKGKWIDVHELLFETIEVLEQEPCEDCISREAVIEVLTRNGVHFCDMVKITSELKELPSVTPKPKTGNWVKSNNGMFAECSDCGKHGEYGLLKQYKYCPNCGAKMEEKEKNNG